VRTILLRTFDCPAFDPIQPFRSNFVKSPRFLHHATVIAITGKSYRLRNQKPPDADGPRADAEQSKPVNLPTGSAARRKTKSTSENPTAEKTIACQS
jgi:hypothetical protein